MLQVPTWQASPPCAPSRRSAAPLRRDPSSSAVSVEEPAPGRRSVWARRRSQILQQALYHQQSYDQDGSSYGGKSWKRLRPPLFGDRSGESGSAAKGLPPGPITLVQEFEQKKIQMIEGVLPSGRQLIIETHEQAEGEF